MFQLININTDSTQNYTYTTENLKQIMEMPTLEAHKALQLFFL